MINSRAESFRTRLQRPDAEHRRFSALRFILRDRTALVGTVLVSLTVMMGIFGPTLAPFDPYAFVGERLQPPGPVHLLGTDELGRDLLSRVLYGARISMVVSVSAVGIASLIGTGLGVAAGYHRGLLDSALMRFMDILFGFPAILLALTITAVLGTTLQNLILAITIVYVPTFARVARGSTMVVAAEPYVDAAKSVGAGHARIMVRHVLPNIASPLIVLFSIYMAYGILIEAALSFLGLGAPPPTPSWGSMLSTGKAYLEISAWVALAPGFAMMFAVLGFNLLGDGIQDALDPKLRIQ
jgi:peptide/nickel transport system permease protein